MDWPALNVDHTNQVKLTCIGFGLKRVKYRLNFIWPNPIHLHPIQKKNPFATPNYKIKIKWDAGQFKSTHVHLYFIITLKQCIRLAINIYTKNNIIIIIVLGWNHSLRYHSMEYTTKNSQSTITHKRLHSQTMSHSFTWFSHSVYVHKRETSSYLSSI